MSIKLRWFVKIGSSSGRNKPDPVLQVWTGDYWETIQTIELSNSDNVCEDDLGNMFDHTKLPDTLPE